MIGSWVVSISGRQLRPTLRSRSAAIAAKASAVAGQRLGKADAALIRAETGFAIGGVAPVGHLGPVEAYWDPRLSEFDTVWAAAGTPRHVFAAPPAALCRAAGARVADFTA